MEEENCPKKCCNYKSWGGKREQAGRKKTCSKKVSFNRRINENILNILKKYANIHGITVTEALESAILLQNNIYTLQKTEGIMKIVIPTKNEKLCAHFGNCESFSFVEVDKNTNNIISIESKIPEDGISCQSASWISEQGANIVLVGGMGMRPINILHQNGVKIVAGCPELPIRELVEKYLANELQFGENSCSGGHHDCHGHHHGDGHNCQH